MIDPRALAEAGLAIFENRLILDARPPVTDDELTEVAARCGGPVPAGLAALWRTSFGGGLDYDLTVTLGAAEQALSLRELFYPGSDGYHDLWGWIEEDGPPGYLPFGGFEYLERVYAHLPTGEIYAWQQGLPPGWELAEGDRAGAIAADVPALFAQLTLEQDPWETDDPDHGIDLRDVLDELPPALRDPLRGLVRSAVLDWHGALDAGTIAGSPRLRRLALDRGATDVAVLSRLAAQGCDLGEPARGGMTALDIALAGSAHDAARWLLGRDVPVTHALRFGASGIDADLAAELLRRGARADSHALSAVVENPDPEVITLIGRAAGPISASLALRVRMLIAQAEIAAERGDTGAQRRAEALRVLAGRE
ncbi:hypothetical protein J2S43_003785 [Catenuloplanes nepalensis]|uniref:SMI1/KNR4 family protein n=1 Tax=Catenuloplanes nepalensis TaxID=587533 RepID=A0ABT9MVM0_9ACTN|nr:SMI1/KNR4 family protein [Catenuloplanes nepalensis]MDP9795273.1 hypothetical protein [Catenuloplanes nepalensis]